MFLCLSNRCVIKRRISPAVYEVSYSNGILPPSNNVHFSRSPLRFSRTSLFNRFSVIRTSSGRILNYFVHKDEQPPPSYEEAVHMRAAPPPHQIANQNDGDANRFLPVTPPLQLRIPIVSYSRFLLQIHKSLYSNE
ncbi:hypothetical protein AB6A40_010569 [Gnathostoma spinigerum]|uniref:Uncharacterized protein n=1 Tax=Gnathostoma spinigerum TaxID=75299 RepID=A0ABD6EWJ6_9BILA